MNNYTLGDFRRMTQDLPDTAIIKKKIPEPGTEWGELYEDPDIEIVSDIPSMKIGNVMIII